MTPPLSGRLAATKAFTLRRWMIASFAASSRRKARAAKPTPPLAGSACPHALFRAARLTLSALLAISTAAATAPTSIGSPSGVPVPCRSTRITRSSTDRKLAASTRCCAGPLGAVRALLRPSWLTPEPATITPPSPPPTAATIVQASDRT